MKKIIAIVCFLITGNLCAQNQHEPQNWLKLYSPFVNVIYKTGQEKEAQHIANTINFIQKNKSKSIGYHFHPIDIVLRSKTVESNGFVTVSPFRSEFFNTAPTTFNSLGTTNWISTLAIHEYRHVQQFLNHKTGATNVLYYLFGESGWGLGSVLAVPDWYFEGDAVVMETALTKSGRGRLPKFTALQRALSKDGIQYKYQKARNGSFKNLVPNHYINGYLMLNYFRNHFDASRLDNITQKAASYQFPFYPFTYQLKRETGLSTTKLYQNTLKEYQTIWNEQRTQLKAESYQAVTQEDSKVALYNFPQVLENGNIITLKTQLDNIPTFYEIDSQGKEKKIVANIINEDNYFHYQNKQLVFTGFSYHPRYNYTNYSDIFIYDIQTKKRQKITQNKRYFSPFFNADNSKIVAVETNEGAYQLVILDTTGKPLSTYNVSGVLVRPKFANATTLVYLKQENHRLAIFKLDTKSKKETQVTQWTSHTLDDIFVANNKVYYSASFNGIDNIYASPLDGSKQTLQITNATIGAYQPAVKNNTIYFVETTSKGSKISSTKISPKEIAFVEPIKMNWNNQKTVAFEEGTILDTIPNKSYSKKSYTSLFEDLRFHDWFYTLSDQEITANVMATTLLNDFSLNAGTNVYLNENNSFGLNATATYKKWYPILSLALEYNHREFDGIVTTSDDGTEYKGVHQFETVQVLPSITLPYAQINGNYSNSAALSLGYELQSRLGHTFTLEDTEQVIEIDNFTSNYFKMQFAAASIRRAATQNINSRAGVSTSLSYDQGFSNTSGLNGYYLASFSRLFFPGILKSHNGYLALGYQKNDIQQTDNFRYARGFETSNATEAYNFSVNYQLPILYPDFGLLGITYFKRIRANLFADFSEIQFHSNFKTQQNSAGFEIIFDNTFLNISQGLIGIGYRGSFLLTNDYQEPSNQFVSQIFLSTTLF